MAQAGGIRYRTGAVLEDAVFAAFDVVDDFAHRWQAVLFAAAALLIPLAVYAATAAPTLYTIDSPELTTAAWTRGIAHSPGYPLYTVVGWAFSHAFAVGDPSYRLNVLSGVFGALSIVLVYGLARRVADCSRLVALSAALTLAFSYWMWRESLYAEVYTLDVALLAGTLLLAFTWRENGDAKALLGAGLCFGMGMANRTSFLGLLPGMLLFVAVAYATGRRPFGPLPLMGAAAAAVVGLGFYLYIPLNYRTDPQYIWLSWFGEQYARDLSSRDGFWFLVSSEGFERYAFAVSGADFLTNLARQASWLTSSFMGVGVAIGAYGAWLHARRDLAGFLWFASTAAGYVVFFAAYNVADREFMVLPVYAVWAVWLAMGLVAVPSVVRFIIGESRHVATVSAAALVALPLIAFGVTLRAADLSGEYSIRNDSEYLMRQAEPDALFVGTWVEVSPLLYLQEVDGLRPDIQLSVNSQQNPFVARSLARPLAERPVYLGVLSRQLSEPYRLTQVVGTWHRVELEPGALPAEAGGGH